MHIKHSLNTCIRKFAIFLAHLKESSFSMQKISKSQRKTTKLTPLGMQNIQKRQKQILVDTTQNSAASNKN